MQTQYIGRLSNNISIESFLTKQPNFKDYELLYHTEEGVLKSYYKGVTKELSYDVSFLTNVIFISDVAIDEYYTTNGECSIIENNIALVRLNKNVKYLYIPILKYIKALAFDKGLDNSIKNDTINIIRDETIKIININNANIPCKEISILYNNDTPVNLNIYFDDISNHYGDRNNPHKVTAFQLGLGNVDNTSDKDKPVSDKTMFLINERDSNFKSKIETYFKRHTKVIDDTKIEFAKTLESNIETFKNEIINDAKEQLENVKKLGNIDTYVDTKFEEFKDRFNILLESFNRNSNKSLQDIKNVMISIEKHRNDYKEDVIKANETFDKRIADYDKRIEIMERQLLEQASTIRKMRQ